MVLLDLLTNFSSNIVRDPGKTGWTGSKEPVFFIIFGIILPKFIINDTADLNEFNINTAKKETKINYIDKPLIRFFAIGTKVYKNDLNNVCVDMYSFFGFKLGTVEFLPEGNSRAKWFFF